MYISENTHKTQVTGIWGCPLRKIRDKQICFCKQRSKYSSSFSAALLCIPLHSLYSCAHICISSFQVLFPADSCLLVWDHPYKAEDNPLHWTHYLEAFPHSHTIPPPHSPKDKQQKGQISPRDNFKTKQLGNYFTVRLRFEGHFYITFNACKTKKWKVSEVLSACNCP